MAFWARYWPVIVGLIYFLAPFDLIPDFLPVIGRVDDVLLLFWLYWTFMRKKSRYSRDGAADSGGDARGSTGGSYSSGGGGRSEQSRTARDPYRILNLNRPASVDEIKRAYRLQASRYHPDKVAHLGEELQTLAKEKFQDVQWAYEELMKRQERS